MKSTGAGGSIKRQHDVWLWLETDQKNRGLKRYTIEKSFAELIWSRFNQQREGVWGWLEQRDQRLNCLEPHTG